MPAGHLVRALLYNIRWQLLALELGFGSGRDLLASDVAGGTRLASSTAECRITGANGARR